MSRRIEVWVRWALALALLPAVAALDGRYVHQSEYQSDHELLLRIDSTTRNTAKRLRDIYCAGKPPGCQ